MTALKQTFYASMCLVFISFYPQPSAAGGDFTAADLLAWSEEGRSNYYQIAIGMMGAAFSQNRIGYGTCIGEWYFADNGNTDNPHRELDRAMKRFSEYDPRGIIIGIIEKKCGSLPLKSRN